MKKIYKCVGCDKTFKVVEDPRKPPSNQHEIECNVECPFCAKTKAIVWPQNGFILVLPNDPE